MTDETFRQTPRKLVPGHKQEYAQSEQQPMGNPLEKIQSMRDAMAVETGHAPETPQSEAAPFQMSGKIPEAFKKAIQQGGGPLLPPPQQGGRKARPTPDRQLKTSLRGGPSEQLEELLTKLVDFDTWEEIELPSRGRFYDNIPDTLHIRAMTGEEEQILATPRHVKRGRAIDMIFNKCIREPINTQDLLSVDRTFLLIFLRGISYTPEYDVEIKCPECSSSFNNIINLSSDIEVTDCPEDFGPENLIGVLPTTGFHYKYRLATGKDEQMVTSYRETRLAKFDQSDDDTLLYRTSILLDSIESVTDRYELGILLKKLPINDVAHLRNVINEPPFGIKTEIGIICPNCTHEFKIDLPLEAGFFFPRKKSNPERD
jgi:hypothetical protein